MFAHKILNVIGTVTFPGFQLFSHGDICHILPLSIVKLSKLLTKKVKKIIIYSAKIIWGYN